MSTLIKNLPYPATVAKGNRGDLFPLFEQWENITHKAPSLSINSAGQMLLIREPQGNSAALREGNVGTTPVFYTIPLGLYANQHSVGTITDGPLVIT